MTVGTQEVEAGRNNMFPTHFNPGCVLCLDKIAESAYLHKLGSFLCVPFTVALKSPTHSRGYWFDFQPQSFEELCLREVEQAL